MKDKLKNYLISYAQHISDFNELCDVATKSLEDYKFAVSISSHKFSDIVDTVFPIYNVKYKLNDLERIEIDKKFDLVTL